MMEAIRGVRGMGIERGEGRVGDGRWGRRWRAGRKR